MSDRFIFVSHPERGLFLSFEKQKNQNYQDHSRLIDKHQLPTHGKAYDSMVRGYGVIDHEQKSIRVYLAGTGYVNHHYNPEEVRAALLKLHPEAKDYSWWHMSFQYVKEAAADRFLYGDCLSFAQALQETMGGEIYALLQNGKPLHAFLKVNGKSYDFKGQRGTYSMALDCAGSADGFTVEGPISPEQLPFKRNPKALDAARKYIQNNTKLFKTAALPNVDTASVRAALDAVKPTLFGQRIGNVEAQTILNRALAPFDIRFENGWSHSGNPDQASVFVCGAEYDVNSGWTNIQYEDEFCFQFEDMSEQEWTTFVNVIAQLYAHESIHSHQVERIHEDNDDYKAQQVTRKMDVLDRGGSEAKYLELKQEMQAFARQAIEELYDIGYNKDKILEILRNRERMKECAGDSHSLWTYWENFGIYNDPVWGEFLQTIYRLMSGKQAFNEHRKRSEQMDPWAGLKFREATGCKPRPGDNPPQRTGEGDYIFYHGTRAEDVQSIMENGLRPDNLGYCGVSTTPGSCAMFGYYKGGKPHVLRLVFDKNWLENNAQFINEGSHKNLYLLDHPEGEPWSGVPRSALKSVEDITEDYMEGKLAAETKEVLWVYHPSIGVRIMNGYKWEHEQFIKKLSKSDPRWLNIPFDDIRRGFASVYPTAKVVKIYLYSAWRWKFLPNDVYAEFKRKYPRYGIIEHEANVTAAKKKPAELSKLLELHDQIKGDPRRTTANGSLMCLYAELPKLIDGIEALAKKLKVYNEQAQGYVTRARERLSAAKQLREAGPASQKAELALISAHSALLWLNWPYVKDDFKVSGKEQSAWIWTPTLGIREGLVHVDLLERNGLPTSGPMYDAVSRGYAWVDKSAKQVELRMAGGERPSEDCEWDVEAHFASEFPDFRVDWWWVNKTAAKQTPMRPETRYDEETMGWATQPERREGEIPGAIPLKSLIGTGGINPGDMWEDGANDFFEPPLESESHSQRKEAWDVGKVGDAHAYIWLYNPTTGLKLSDRIEWHDDLPVDFKLLRHKQTQRGVLVLYPKKNLGYVFAYKMYDAISHDDADFISNDAWNSIQAKFPKYKLEERQGLSRAVGTGNASNFVRSLTASGNTWYHITPRSRTAKIRKEGLVPGKKRQWRNQMGVPLGERGKIYLFSNRYSAIRFGSRLEWETKKPVDILTIEYQPKDIQPDPHLESQMDRGNWWMTSDTIPPEAIKGVEPLTVELKRELVEWDRKRFEGQE